jgi:hypothetical protein
MSYPGGGSVVAGTSPGSSSPGQTHTKPSFSTHGSAATPTPRQWTVEGIVVQSPEPLKRQPWYAHSTWAWGFGVWSTVTAGSGLAG